MTRRGAEATAPETRKQIDPRNRAARRVCCTWSIKAVCIAWYVVTLKNSVPTDWTTAAHSAAPPPLRECRPDQASQLCSPPPAVNRIEPMKVMRRRVADELRVAGERPHEETRRPESETEGHPASTTHHPSLVPVVMAGFRAGPNITPNLATEADGIKAHVPALVAGRARRGSAAAGGCPRVEGRQFGRRQCGQTVRLPAAGELITSRAVVRAAPDQTARALRSCIASDPMGNSRSCSRSRHGAALTAIAGTSSACRAGRTDSGAGCGTSSSICIRREPIVVRVGERRIFVRRSRTTAC